MKKIVLGLFLTSFAYSAVAADRALECSFTEPFFHLNLDLNTGTLMEIRPDWDDDSGSQTVGTILYTDLIVESLPVNANSFQILAKKPSNGKVILKATLNYRGSDDMSDNVYPFAVDFYGKSKLYHGGCTTETLPTFDPMVLGEMSLSFSKEATKAISLCFARAASDWTSDPSDNVAGITKFYALYNAELVPGVAAEVSSAFSYNEREMLSTALQLARTPAEDGAAALNALIEAKMDYCSLYGKLLHTRFTN